MPDTTVSNGHCVCNMTGSGGQAWPCRCRRWSAAVCNASTMKTVIPKPQCNQSLLPHFWSCYMLTLPALSSQWSWINPQMLWTFWSFATTLWNMSWHMQPPIKLKKTFTKFLWQGYISIFGAPAKPLSNWVANFESNIIRELCEVMGIWKVRTSPYHAQSNGQVEQAHQMLMHMIGKLSKDRKADWLKHLPELVHAYNSKR